MTKIVVVGAGVLGLTAALRLKQDDSHYDITIIASDIPGDINIKYTSPYAGANWMSFAGRDDKRMQALDKPGYFEFLKLAENPRSGVWKKPNLLFYTQIALDRKQGLREAFVPWYGSFTNYRKLSEKELLPGTVFGGEYDGVVISVPIYLNYLMQECLAHGITIRRVPRIKSIDEARELHSSGKRSDLVINCSALWAKDIEGVDDPNKNFPVRGQVLLVRNNSPKATIVEGFENPQEMLYIFPRKEGGSIIGGSFVPNDWNESEDKELTKRIIERALKFMPELVDDKGIKNPRELDIVQKNVGLRPFREGGMRIEIDQNRNWLIHNYGAGGGGYQGSYGFADEVVQLARRAKRAVAKL